MCQNTNVSMFLVSMYLAKVPHRGSMYRDEMLMLLRDFSAILHSLVALY